MSGFFLLVLCIFLELQRNRKHCVSWIPVKQGVSCSWQFVIIKIKQGCHVNSIRSFAITLRRWTQLRHVILTWFINRNDTSCLFSNCRLVFMLLSTTSSTTALLTRLASHCTFYHVLLIPNLSDICINCFGGRFDISRHTHTFAPAHLSCI